MKRDTDKLDRALDSILDEIREETPDAATEKAAEERVWSVLSRELEQHAAPPAPEFERIRDCDGFQELLPDYLADRLPRAKLLLLEDHVRECVACRGALKRARTGSPSAVTQLPAAAGPSQGRISTFAWRVAAAAVIFVAFIGLNIKTDFFTFETGGLIRIEAVEGEIFRVTESGTVPLSAGDSVSLARGEAVRAAKGSSAMLRLADDSQVEMRERSQLQVKQRRPLLPLRRSDGLIDLTRGSIIVEASDQGSGHLYVETNDCEVAVRGTVFSVSHGTKGSRVSVIEGEVRVDFQGGKNLLQPGQQATTHPSLDKVPVEVDIAWSQNLTAHLELLREMQALGRDIDTALTGPSRRGTDLLEAAPGDTVVYVAVPNLSEGLGRAYTILQERVASNEVLRDWWEQQFVPSGTDRKLEEVVEKIREYGAYLDEEVILTLQLDARGQPDEPLLLARVLDPAGFRGFLQQELASIDVEATHRPLVRLAEGSAPPVFVKGETADLELWMRDGLLAASFGLERLHALARSSGEGADGMLPSTPFGRRLADAYEEGVEWLVGVDLERCIRAADGADGPDETLERLGLLDVQHLIAERKQIDAKTQTRATLTFDRPRRGVAAWLAEPAPMGALDFVSPQAHLAAAFVVRDLDLVVEELFDFIGEADPQFEQRLEEFESEHGVDIRRDFAAPLGGEFAMAMDGPLLPKPSWKLILEVYDPARLRQALEQSVLQINRLANDAGAQGLRLHTETVGGREFLRLESLDTGLSVHLTFHDGYLLAGPSRAVLDLSLRTRAAGLTLARSAEFLDLLPQDGRVNYSAMAYENLGPVIGPLAQISSTMAELTPEQRSLLETLGAESRPGVGLLYGESDRIVFVNTSDGGLLDPGLESLFRLNGLFSMQQSLAQAVAAGAVH